MFFLPFSFISFSSLLDFKTDAMNTTRFFTNKAAEYSILHY